MRWSLFDARTEAKVKGLPWLVDRAELRLTPALIRDQGSPTLWVPLPKLRGPFFVRVELFDAKRRPLDVADTASFP